MVFIGSRPPAKTSFALNTKRLSEDANPKGPPEQAPGADTNTTEGFSQSDDKYLADEEKSLSLIVIKSFLLIA